MFFEKKQPAEKHCRSILNNSYILNEGWSLLVIIGTSKERAAFVETYVDGVSSIKAVKFKTDMQPGFLVTYSQLPDDRASAWMPANFPDIASAKADFERLCLTKGHYHSRLCASTEEPDRFLAALDCFIVAEVDSAINSAYRKVFHDLPKYIELGEHATQTNESNSSSRCSIM